MAKDWEGAEVTLLVYKMDGTAASTLVDTRPTYLDSDTMADVFSKFDMETHMVVIVPAAAEAWW